MNECHMLFPMANVQVRRSGDFRCHLLEMDLCQFSSNGYKVSEWWMFLFLLYIASLLVGIVFVVAGFSSSDYGMGAVGLVLCIAGACMAVVCDLLRRFGCGWEKIFASQSTHSGEISQGNSDAVINFPYLPGYTGLSSAVVDRRPDNPPPYAIFEGCDVSEESYTARSVISCSSGPSSGTENTDVSDRRCESPCSIDRTSEATETIQTFSRTDHDNLHDVPRVSPNVALACAGIENGNQKPSPPPYDFVVVNTCDRSRLSWIRDSPPPYAEFA